MESVWSVYKLSTESIGSCRELVANCVHTADATKQFCRIGVGGVYWALFTLHCGQRIVDSDLPCAVGRSRILFCYTCYMDKLMIDC